ncbi:putative pinoresinol-lariciresinol reductase 3 [Lachnellula cervina]|uniref:Putative pinoresinol-lariciresinol reductase 3 n=1 Tax=Lachnellula cervina TaxID=1316786 RepID=A0A7D8Z200_9HELO|nr:putative pinoresinol-lariciresinol reductase 3 [Lachnellula cervina]
MLILIAGITGALGQRLANVAISRGISVRGLGRNPDSLSTELSSQLESFIKSTSYYDVPALEKAVSGVDAVINAYAPTPVLDLDGHLLLLRAAERAGIKIFIASSWSRDWTNLKFGDFEHYNNHIAFEHQIATTSPIRPVYLFTGLFADLLYTPYGPGGFDTGGEKPRMKYWGDDGKTNKWPWSTQADAAEYTIDILLYGKGVQAGEGGFFRVRSGTTTVEELAAVYEKVYGIAVDVTREGSVEDLEAELARLRKERGRARYIEYMWEAAAVVASKGLWENSDITILDQFRKPTSLEEHFGGEKNKG